MPAMFFLRVAIIHLSFGVVLSGVGQVARCDADSPFECGHQIGLQMRDAIRQVVGNSVARLSPYIGLGQGREAFAALVRVNQNAYPDVAAEYAGIASGAGLSTDHVFMASLANELAGLARQSGIFLPGSKSCTDYHVIGSTIQAWGHTEDNLPEWSNLSFRVEARIGSFRFTGFTYAPDVVGWAWGFNSHGLAQSVNALFPMNISIGLGVNFVARDMLNARSLDDAVTRACVPGLASGQHFNLGSIHEKDRQLLVETSPLGCAVRTLSFDPSAHQAATAFHCNNYESAKFRGLDGAGDASSRHRMSRLADISTPQSLSDLENLLSDRHDEVYPVHRNAARPDICETLNTVIFNVRDERVLIWDQTSPAVSPSFLAYNWSSLELESSNSSAARFNGIVVAFV